MAGEVLFNDGIGFVIFVMVLGMVHGNGHAAWQQAVFFFAKEALGGIVLGLSLGWIAYEMLKRVDN
jgi:CPA1 family monovalent cation:H+ antiporter